MSFLYRSSHKHNICVDMLREGYHKSFSELFALIQKWNASREAAGPGTDIWQEKSLEEQPDKLDQLYHFLTKTEAAQRAGNFEDMYENVLALAQYFKKSGDKWLSDHFFESSLNIAKMVHTDGGRKKAEAHANVGLVLLEQGQLKKATEHYEAFHHLTVGHIWEDKTGRTHHSLACENLWRIYTLLADKMLENKEHHRAIKSLIKAFEIAKEGDDKRMEGKAAYRLGLAYRSAGDPETAITYLKTYMDISKVLRDNVGLGKAYEAMAKALESQGKIAETVMYLEKFVELAKISNETHNLVDACICLGSIYNARGQCDKACEFFDQAYAVAKNLSDLPLLEMTQVHYGIAKTHGLMTTVSKHIEAAGQVNIERLLTWKDSRNDMFNDPIALVEPT
ncbi:tetratricopeptide repeat protein 29 [Latimeria chalumnae]|uniref:tetratricopeptide repeat protein 29 n=1 Tax=Latimeria chalumnae TaxID=7897 RepID=UPI00313B6C35